MVAGEPLTRWSIVDDEPEWVTLRPPTGRTGLLLQSEPAFVPPVCPAAPGQQQMMMQLDIAVEDLDEAVALGR